MNSKTRIKVDQLLVKIRQKTYLHSNKISNKLQMSIKGRQMALIQMILGRFE